MESNKKSEFSSDDVFEIPSKPPSYDELFGTENGILADINDDEFLTGVFEFKLKQKFKTEGILNFEIKFNTNSSLFIRAKENIKKEHPSVSFKMEFTSITNQTGQLKLPQTILLKPYLQKIYTKRKENSMQKNCFPLYNNLRNSVGASVMRGKSKVAFKPQIIELYNFWIYDPFKKSYKYNFEVPLELKRETVENVALSEEAVYLVNFDTEFGDIKKLLETGFPIKLE